VWQRGRDLLPKCGHEQFLTQLTEQLECAHAEGVIGISLTWGNVVIGETTKHLVIELDKAQVMQVGVIERNATSARF